MRNFIRIVAALALVALVAIVGINVYNAGVSAGLAEAARAAAAAGESAPVVIPPYVGGGYGGYGPGWGIGFGIFGLIFWVLGIFLVIGLVRAAFGWGRWGGPRRGPGERWGPGGYGRDERRQRLEELHRELHRGDQEAGTGASPA